VRFRLFLIKLRAAFRAIFGFIGIDRIAILALLNQPLPAPITKGGVGSVDFMTGWAKLISRCDGSNGLGIVGIVAGLFNIAGDAENNRHKGDEPNRKDEYGNHGKHRVTGRHHIRNHKDHIDEHCDHHNCYERDEDRCTPTRPVPIIHILTPPSLLVGKFGFSNNHFLLSPILT
jgi:hypothetical protein